MARGTVLIDKQYIRARYVFNYFSNSIAYNITMLEMSTENFRDFELYAKLNNAKAVWKGTKLKFLIRPRSNRFCCMSMKVGHSRESKEG